MPQNKKQLRNIFFWTSAMLTFGLVLFSIIKVFFAEPEITVSETKENSSDLNFTPEYQRTAEKVLLTISSQQQDTEFAKLMERTYGSLLEKFPSYTEFKIIVSEENFPVIENLIKNKHLSHKATYIKINGIQIEPWAQDYFEPVTLNSDGTFFLLPKEDLEIAPVRAYSNFSQRASDRISLITQTMGSQNTIQMPFFFEGGNVMIAGDPYSKKPLALVDYTNIADSQTQENSSPDKIAGLVSKNFGIKTALIGNMPRHGNFIHLDQSILFLPDDIVFLNKIIGFPKSSAAKQHETYKSQLEQLGFKIIEIETSQTAVKNSQSSLNAIAFFDKQENKQKVIYPVFENEIKDNSKELSKENLQGKALQMHEELEKLDIQPIPLLDQDLFENNAGYHCLVNILR